MVLLALAHVIPNRMGSGAPQRETRVMQASLWDRPIMDGVTRLSSERTVTACKISSIMNPVAVRRFITFLCVTCVASVVCAQAVFTADYYLANPDAYLGKEVLSVSSLNPRNEQSREDGLRQLDAQTFNQHKNGGTLMVLASPATAASLIQLCGTNRSGRVGSKVTMIHGIFSQEKTARYYLYVRH